MMFIKEIIQINKSAINQMNHQKNRMCLINKIIKN